MSMISTISDLIYKNRSAFVNIVDLLFDISWTQYINKDVLRKSNFIVHGDNVYKIKTIIATDLSTSATDAIVYVHNCGNYETFFENSKISY